MEHNSVMRPLSHLREEGVEVSVIDTDKTGYISPDLIIKAVKKNTKLLIATHASNVTGTINDIDKIGSLCKERGILFLVDAAQTSGVIPIDINRVHVDFLAFSGHKGLMGPQDTGALYRGGENISMSPLMRGGTGSLSSREIQPDFSPDRYESGTLNVVGIAGLGAGIEYIQNYGIEKILYHDNHLLDILLDKLSGNNRISIYGVKKPYKQTGVLSMNIEGISPSNTGEILDREYGIQTRVGLHCAPSAHRTIGTFPDGTVRLSWGIFTKEKDVLRVVRALKRISEKF
jgi:cysteine desulfurase family protein